ncbi:hypothetical protein N656DRAFT_773751 [Canariomyces notabilis]|uniref:Kinetochore protein Sos7 coiled-coil domain-containing protein n=1 Tax=Canariomyces notabilis TaxID=2074819 RepID=A0AAN6TNA0_9PEZI|nr:hypothetical protein N656DRAFT_773751 [Canariomyces arenarius]
MTRRTSPAKPQPDGQRAASVLRALDELESASGEEQLTMIKISEPISSAVSHAGNSSTATNPAITARTSDVSTASLDAPTPSSLEADLEHYKELFAKLRFSYVEQVTKEKFIRAIVGDPPLIVTPQENADLEAGNLEAKAALKALKTEVASTVAQLEARGRALAAMYERVRADKARLAELPGRIEGLEKSVAELRRAAGPESGQGMDMPLGKTREVVERKRADLAGLDRQLEQLASLAPRKRKEAERLRAEVAALENKKVHSAAAAREAKRRRENAQGGVEDELEARGRWYRASELVLRRVLDLEDVR